MSYKPGDYLVISDISGHKFLRSQCRFDWRGLLMSEKEWSEKHPQLDIEPRQDSIAVADPRPRQPTRWADGQGPDDPKISF